MATDMTVANTIRTQIGGRALMMIGAKDLAGDAKSLRFRIGRNAKTVTHVTVTLTPADLYEIVFIRARGSKITEVAREEIYADDLHRSIERNTGLYTSL